MNYVKGMTGIDKSKQKTLIIKLYGTTTDLTSPNIKKFTDLLKRMSEVK